MKYINERLLGIALGLGYLTSFRFLGPIGISEILFLIVICSLSLKHLKAVFRIGIDTESIVRAYLLISFIIVLPITTLVVYSRTELASEPIYIVSSIMGLLLTFLLVEAMKKGFNFKSVTLWFAMAFICTNLITLLVFPSELHRYRGGADNPNQLVFYASSLSLLLVIYGGRMGLLMLSIVIFIMLKVKSDAYNLTLFVVVVVYTMTKLFYVSKLKLRDNFMLVLITILPISFFIIMSNIDHIIEIWNVADEGGTRVRLFIHGFVASIYSPLFGYGTGSFSGIDAPFVGSEAHNTFLDLSTQFGLIVPLIIYYSLIRYFLCTLSEHRFLVASFVLAYIIAGMFHYSGRHFVFWTELAVFYYAIFLQKQTSTNRQSSVRGQCN